MSVASWSKLGISAPGQPISHDYGTKSNKSNMGYQFSNTDRHRLHTPEARRKRHKVELRKYFFPLATETAPSPPLLQYGSIISRQSAVCSYVLTIIAGIPDQPAQWPVNPKCKLFRILDWVPNGGNIKREIFFLRMGSCAMVWNLSFSLVTIMKSKTM